MAWIRKFRRWCAKPRLLHEEIGDWVTAALETKTIGELEAFADTCPLWYRLEYRRARQGDIHAAFIRSSASADWMRGVYALLKDYDWLLVSTESDILSHIALLENTATASAHEGDVDKIRKWIAVLSVSQETSLEPCPHRCTQSGKDLSQPIILQAFAQSNCSLPFQRFVLDVLNEYNWLTDDTRSTIQQQIMEQLEILVIQTNKGTQMAEDIPIPSTTAIAIQPPVGEVNTSQTPISAIMALGPDDIFSLNGKLPWDCPEDMKFFKETTMGHTVVMGYNTFKSLEFKPLPDRLNIIVLDNGSDLGVMPEVTPVGSWGGVVAEMKLLVYVNEAEQRDKAYYENIVEFSRRKTPTGKKIWVIGGASMLGAMLEYKLIDELVVTRIPTQYMKERKEPLHWCQYFRVSSYTDDMVFDETIPLSANDRYLSYTRWYKPVHVELTARQIQHLEALGVNAYNDARSGYGPKKFREGSVEEVVYNLMYKAGSSRLGTHIPGAG